MISGPSGVGKSTIAKEALARTGAVFSVSATTRPARPNETHGRDYFFVDRETFDKMIADGEMLEWAEVFGQKYGTPGGPVRQGLAEGKTVLLDIDVQGAVQVRHTMPHATFVLVVPPSDEELETRLRRRRSEGSQAVAGRLAKAKEEITAAERSGAYQHRIVNDDLDSAIRQLVAILTRENGNR